MSLHFAPESKTLVQTKFEDNKQASIKMKNQTANVVLFKVDPTNTSNQQPEPFVGQLISMQEIEIKLFLKDTANSIASEDDSASISQIQSETTIEQEQIEYQFSQTDHFEFVVFRIKLSQLNTKTISNLYTASAKRESEVEVRAMEEEEDDTDLEFGQAYLAGGCFWFTQEKFDNNFSHIKHFKTEVGYLNVAALIDNPTFRDVNKGESGWVQGIKIIYDERKISFTTLVEQFFETINWTQEDGQFVDKGNHYKTCVFQQSEFEAKQARLEMNKRSKIMGPMRTDLRSWKDFVLAEPYHHQYYKKNAGMQEIQKKRSGRLEFFEKMEGKKNDSIL